MPIASRTVSRFVVRKGTAASWASINPILADGEPGYAKDTHVLKIGNGTSHWNDLAATFPLDVGASVAADAATAVAASASAATAAGNAATAATNAAASAAAAAAVGATGDAATAGFVNSGGSATSAALVAKFVGKNQLQHRITDGPYLAAGDGTTNDAAAFNSAGAAAAASGLPVVVPYTPNGFLFSTATNLVSGVKYIFEGGVRVKRGGASTATFLNANGTTGVVIQGGTFDGNGLISSNVIHVGYRTSILSATFMESGIEQQSSYAIGAATTSTTSDVYIKDCRFVNRRNNVHVQGTAARWTVKDCDISGFASTAIAVDGNNASRSTDIIIENNRCHDHDSATLAVSNKAITGSTTATLTVPTYTYTVTNKALTSGVATITVGAHNFTPGQTLTVSGVSAPFDGRWQVTSVTGTTFSYTVEGAANVTSTGSGGTASTFVVGQSVWVDVGDVIYDGTHVISAVTPTTISWTRSATANGSAASTGTVTSGNRQPISVQGDDSETFYHERISIIGNQVYGNYNGHPATVSAGTADTISVHHTKTVVIAGNISEGSGDCGITVSFRSTGVTLGENTVTGAYNCGIAVGASNGTAYVRGLKAGSNTLRNCGKNGAVSWGSTGINIRRLYGGIVSNNWLIDDQFTAVGTGAVTFTDAGDLVTTPANHGLTTGQMVQFADVITTTGIVPGRPYYATVASPTTFTLSDNPGGATLALTTNGTGTGLAVAAPTMAYGITVGDTTGTSTDVHFGPNHSFGLTTAKRLTPAGNLRLTFSDIPTTIIKPSDTVLALNSTALVADPHLVTGTLEANGTYEIDATLAYTTNAVAGATPGISVGITIPAGATVTWYGDASGTNATGSALTTLNSNRAFLVSSGSVLNSGGVTGATPVREILKIRVVLGTTAGTVGIKESQQTADAVNATTVLSNSSLTYRRVA